MSATDPFPRDRFGALVRRLPRYGRLAWTLSRHPQVNRRRRAALLAGVVYVLSPIDLVPGFIPVAGQLDDAAAVLIALSVALRSLTSEERAAALESANLAAGDIQDDLATIRACYAWMARAGLRVGARAARTLARGAGRLAGGVGARLRR
ncbi:MAG: YkvA family protein [Candidatus Limnocylindria bacterium]